jgi:hypothetical protein
MNNMLIANNIAVAVQWFIGGSFMRGVGELRHLSPAPAHPYNKVHYTT